MSFSIMIPPSAPADFEDAAYDAKISPKPDGRTRVGKAQNELARLGREAVMEIAFDLPVEATVLSGTVSGHVNGDLSGSLNVSISFGTQPPPA